MESQPSTERKLVFFPSDDADSLFLGNDEASDLKDPSPIPGDFSPFNFRFSNLNSPCLAKRTTPERRSPLTRLHGYQNDERKTPFRINPVIKKRTKVNSDPACSTELLLFERDGSPDTEVIKSKIQTGPVDGHDENFDSQSLCHSHFLNAESTAIGSHSRDTLTDLHSIELFDGFFNDERGEDGGKNGDVSVSKLVKMEPLYHLINAYFDNIDCSPFMEHIDQDYEFQILGYVATFLKLRFVNKGQASQKAKIADLFRSQPGRPKKKQKMIQAIFTQTQALMQANFAKAAREKRPGDSYNKAFYLHYFGSKADSSDTIEQQFDCSRNHKNGNLSYDFIEKLFMSPLYAKDFLDTLKNDFLGNYRHIRIRKLSLLFLRWETYFLQNLREAEALEKIRRDVDSARFRLAWTDVELSVYFPYFFALQKHAN